MKKVWFLGLLVAAFLVGCSDNDDNENVSIQVAATEFYVVGEKQLIQVPFTVTPADFALTADDIEMGAMELTTSGDRLSFALKAIQQGSVPGEWVANVEVAFNGVCDFVFSVKNNFSSNEFSVCMKQESGEVYVAEPVVWKRSDADFDDKEEKVDLSDIVAETGGLGNNNLTFFIGFLSGVPLQEDFCVELFNEGKVTLSMVDSESAKNGVYAVKVESTRLNGTKFAVWLPVVVTD